MGGRKVCRLYHPAGGAVLTFLLFWLIKCDVKLDFYPVIMPPAAGQKYQTGDRVLPLLIRLSVSFKTTSFVQNLKADVFTFPGTNP